MNTSSQPCVTPEGVSFKVHVDYVMHECLITDDALIKLSMVGQTEDQDIDRLKIFQAHEARINGVARRLVAAGVKGTPLCVNINSFRPAATTA